MGIRRPLVLVCLGTSLTTGRLSADWVPTLLREIQDQPEARGPIRIYNLGKGSQNSDWLLSQAQSISDLKPTHILTEGGAINDCVDFGSGPAVTRAQHISNIQAMVGNWLTNIPNVDITLQTMSSIATVITPTRPALADYYADEVATATTLGIRVMNNYAGWPKPLNQALTVIDPATGLGDGLHPVWTGAVDTYLYPNVVAYARARMAEFWP